MILKTGCLVWVRNYKNEGWRLQYLVDTLNNLYICEDLNWVPFNKSWTYWNYCLPFENV